MLNPQSPALQKTDPKAALTADLPEEMSAQSEATGEKEGRPRALEQRIVSKSCRGAYYHLRHILLNWKLWAGEGRPKGLHGHSPQTWSTTSRIDLPKPLAKPSVDLPGF